MATAATRTTNRMAKRLDGLGSTIFSEMSQLALDTDSVNLGQGFPDTDGPASVLQAAKDAIDAGLNQYPPGRGLPALRQAIADHQRRFYDLDIDPDSQVLVTVGATEAITASMLAFVEPGDEVIVLEPYYDSYAAAIQMAGGVRVPVRLHAPEFRLDPDELRAAVTPRTRLILLNTPHNPTGTVLTDLELQAVADAAIEHDLLVVTDEVYEHLTYDGIVHHPISTLPGMADRTVTCSSAGKTFSVTGWKIGWVTGAPELVTAVSTAKQFVTFTVGGPFQAAVAQALALGNDYYDGLTTRLTEQRDLLVEGLRTVGFTVRPSAGTYFVTTDTAELGFDDGAEFCRMLPHKVGVVAIPLAVFYDDPTDARSLVRWTFCKRPSVLTEGVRRLAGLR